MWLGMYYRSLRPIILYSNDEIRLKVNHFMTLCLTIILSYMHMVNVSGERLQDHWSSTILFYLQNLVLPAVVHENIQWTGETSSFDYLYVFIQKYNGIFGK